MKIYDKFRRQSNEYELQGEALNIPEDFSSRNNKDNKTESYADLMRA